MTEKPGHRREVTSRIVIDALAARFGGTAYAAVHLARQLAANPEVESVTVLSRSQSIVERGLAGNSGIRCVVLPARPKLELIRRLLWMSVRLPRVVAHERSDVLISMSGMLPRSPGCELVCLLFNPVMFEKRSPGNYLRRRAVRRTGSTAAYVAAPSRPLAEMATAMIGRDCDVVPLGVDHNTFRPSDEPGKEVVCVADFYAHKRHDLLLNAWLRLPSPRPRLRLIGNAAVDRRAHARLLAQIAELPDRASIVLEHRVPLAQLVDSYHHARAFVLPSERESFCMPLLESMACGVPPVVRGLPSLRYTAGLGASYVDGDNPDDWAIALRELLEDNTRHKRARMQALRVASQFSWEAFAAGVLAGVRSRHGE
jgi:glycosyltransferase involved in cell wall biosynthesis